MTGFERDSADIYNKELVCDLEGVGQRIRSVRGHYGLSQNEFANSLHISRKWLSELENGKKCPSGLLLLGMECRYAISRDWLLGGKGSMLVCSEWNENCGEAVRLLKEFAKLSKKSREKLLNILGAFLIIEDSQENKEGSSTIGS